MPTDLFEQRGIKVQGSEPVDLFQQKGIGIEKNEATDWHQMASKVLGGLSFNEAMIPSILSGLSGNKQAEKITQSLGEKIAGEGSYAPETGKIIGQGLPAIMAPEAELGILGRGIAKIPGVGKFVSEAARRVLPQAAIGGATNENPLEGAEHAALAQSAFEAIPGAGKLLGGISEIFNPKKFAGKSIEDIQQAYKDVSARQKEAYRIPTERYEEHLLTVDPKNYFGFTKKDKKYFTPDIRKLNDIFEADPTFGNAHRLQSKIFQDSSKVSTNPGKINTYQSLKSSREMVNNKLKGFLKTDPEALAKYNEGTAITRDEKAPFEAIPTLGKVSRGTINDMTPKELLSTIEKAKKKEIGKYKDKTITAIPENHFLNKIADQLSQRIERGNFATESVPYIGEKYSNILSNPYLQNKIEGLKAPYRGLNKAIMGYLIGDHHE